LKTLTKSKTKRLEKKVLFAALDWGLGHAVRDIPLIRELSASNYKVTLAGSCASLTLLKNEFPELDVFELKPNKIAYSTKRSFFILKLIVQVPRFIKNTRTERQQLKQFLKKETFDLIISDNRYGFRRPDIPCVFITHQIFPKVSRRLRFIEPMLATIHKRLIEKFSICLIPDFAGDINFSGSLSHRKRLGDRYRFIGIVSDFKPIETVTEFNRDLLFIASGPEPQRGLFLNEVYPQIKKSGMKALIVSGQPEHQTVKVEENCTVVSHLSRVSMQDEILKSKYVITQSGYTSVMDFVKLKKKAILIPTPGQPEQEYLAVLMEKSKCFIIEQRHTFNLNDSIGRLNQLDEQFPDVEKIPHENFIEIIHGIVNSDMS
jgi:uncharacterized protein (TIGR00661 family)